MAATLRAPVRAALASSSRARIVTRHSSRCPRAVSGSSATGAPSNVEVITFDLDDTLWPTTPVVMAANKAFVDFCQERIPGFPDCAGINEYMKVSLISPKNTVSRRTPSSTHVESSPISCITHTRPHDTQAIRTEREARSKKLGERHVPLSFAALRIAAGFRAACELGVPEPDAVGIASRGTSFLL
jgi:putative hydrolase of the HAD superfamily